MSVELNLLVLMSESSDYKPVVPVGGCDNVLKSLNLAAHTHLRETRLPGQTCLHPARVFAWARLYLHQYSGHICLRNVSLSWGGSWWCRHSVCFCRVYVSLFAQLQGLIDVCVCVCSGCVRVSWQHEPSSLNLSRWPAEVMKVGSVQLLIVWCSTHRSFALFQTLGIFRTSSRHARG